VWGVELSAEVDQIGNRLWIGFLVCTTQGTAIHALVRPD
jgi:hypothetical protein